jgi:hypothetical protein
MTSNMSIWIVIFMLWFITIPIQFAFWLLAWERHSPTWAYKIMYFIMGDY